MAIKRAIKAGDKSIISFKKAIKVRKITQLVNSATITPNATIANMPLTYNGEGTFYLSGTASAAGGGRTGWGIFIGMIKGHKYLTESFYDKMLLIFTDKINSGNYQGVDKATPIFEFIKESGQYIMGWNVNPGAAYDVTITPQLFDLTEMFGAGHEPATVAEFRAKFPETYYPYQRAVLTAYNKVVRPCARKGEVIQVADLNNFTSPYTRSGITFTNNGDGSITLNGTATADSYVILQPISKSISGYTYLLGSEQNTSEYGVANGLVLPPGAKWTYDPGGGATGAHTNYTLMVKNGVTANNVTIFPQIYNPTAMYGAGNEPKTLAEFRKDYPESYYPYSPIQTKNLFDIRKCTGLISSHLNNESASFFIKNLTQNSLKIKLGAYGIYAYLREPLTLPAGTYTFSCDCDYDAVYNRGGVHLNVGKKNEDNTRIITIKEEAYLPLHRLTLTFTLTEKTEVYLLLQGDGGPDNYTNLNNVFFNIQLEKGSVATDYVPHDYI